MVSVLFDKCPQVAVMQSCSQVPSGGVLARESLFCLKHLSEEEPLHGCAQPCLRACQDGARLEAVEELTEKQRKMPACISIVRQVCVSEEIVCSQYFV